MDLSRISPASWYPGHMHKAERDLHEKLKLVDIILEVADARCPLTSRNPRFRELADHKAWVLLLNKSDLAIPPSLTSWLDHFRRQELVCRALHHHQRQQAGKLVQLLQATATEDRRRRGATTPRLRPTRVMVLGIPNVGKSSVINLLAGGRRARTGPLPGVTRQPQWIPLPGNLELLDTPGVMLPRLADAESGLRLGLIAAIKDTVIGPELLVEYLLHHWRTRDCRECVRRHHLDGFPTTAAEFLEAIGREAGLVGAGDQVRTDAAAAQVLRDFRDGAYGPQMLELP